MAECAFHRDAGGDLASELDGPYGTFLDAMGGSWADLRRLDDVDLWMGTTDNLLESLPRQQLYIATWYELGFQLSTLLSLAGQGAPQDPAGRAGFDRAWGDVFAAFLHSAAEAEIGDVEMRMIHQLLSDLVGPDAERNYANMGYVPGRLRELAEQSDARSLGGLGLPRVASVG